MRPPAGFPGSIKILLTNIELRQRAVADWIFRLLRNRLLEALQRLIVLFLGDFGLSEEHKNLRIGGKFLVYLLQKSHSLVCLALSYIGRSKRDNRLNSIRCRLVGILQRRNALVDLVLTSERRSANLISKHATVVEPSDRIGNGQGTRPVLTAKSDLPQ